MRRDAASGRVHAAPRLSTGAVWPRAVAAALALAAAAPCRAELGLGAGLEYFTWVEATQPEVSERGWRSVFTAYARQAREAGWLLGYEGKFYQGDVGYRGATLAPPAVEVTGTTSYAGMRHEGQLRYRRPRASGRYADVYVALGFEQWRRRLSAYQAEDYRLGYLRLGVEADSPGRGWFVGGGLKLPFQVNEDAHLDWIGMASNPPLKPKPEVSYTARVGYRFGPRLSVAAYADGYRFNRSDEVANSHMGTPIVVYQPQSDLQVYGLEAAITLR